MKIMSFLISERELSAGEMRVIAVGLQCAVSYRGKVEGRERYDYFAEKKKLSVAELDLIRNYGLSLLA